MAESQMESVDNNFSQNDPRMPVLQPERSLTTFGGADW